MFERSFFGYELKLQLGIWYGVPRGWIRLLLLIKKSTALIIHTSNSCSPNQTLVWSAKNLPHNATMEVKQCNDTNGNEIQKIRKAISLKNGTIALECDRRIEIYATWSADWQPTNELTILQSNSARKGASKYSHYLGIHLMNIVPHIRFFFCSNVHT